MPLKVSGFFTFLSQTRTKKCVFESKSGLNKLENLFFFYRFCNGFICCPCVHVRPEGGDLSGNMKTLKDEGFNVAFNAASDSLSGPWSHTRSAHLFFYLLRLFLAAAAAINLGKDGRNERPTEVRQSDPVPAKCGGVFSC